MYPVIDLGKGKKALQLCEGREPVIIFCGPVEDSGAIAMAQSFAQEKGLAAYSPFVYADKAPETKFSDDSARLEALLEKFSKEGKKVFLIGQSYGCFVINDLYRDSPDLFRENNVDAVFQLDPPPFERLGRLDYEKQKQQIIDVLTTIQLTAVSFFKDCQLNDGHDFLNRAKQKLDEVGPPPQVAISAIISSLESSAKKMMTVLHRLRQLYPDAEEEALKCPPQTTVLLSQELIELLQIDQKAYDFSGATGLATDRIIETKVEKHSDLHLENSHIMEILVSLLEIGASGYSPIKIAGKTTETLTPPSPEELIKMLTEKIYSQVSVVQEATGTQYSTALCKAVADALGPSLGKTGTENLVKELSCWCTHFSNPQSQKLEPTLSRDETETIAIRATV